MPLNKTDLEFCIEAGLYSEEAENLTDGMVEELSNNMGCDGDE